MVKYKWKSGKNDQMSVVKLDTGFNIELILPIVPFHKRLIAWGIDLLVQFSYLWVINTLVSAIMYEKWSENYKWLAVLLFLPVFMYHLLCELRMNGQSPGKKIMNIRVIAADGGQPSISQYIIRWCFKVIDLPVFIIGGISQGGWPGWTSVFIFTGLACILLTKYSQRVGDLIAGTVLIDTQNQTSWQDTVFMDVEENYVPTFPQVMQLSDHDVNSIKQILVSAGSRQNNYEYMDRISKKIQTALKIETDMAPFEFMEILLKDYNHIAAK